MKNMENAMAGVGILTFVMGGIVLLMGRSIDDSGEEDFEADPVRAGIIRDKLFCSGPDGMETRMGAVMPVSREGDGDEDPNV